MSGGEGHRLRLALAQVNPTVGDIEGNRDLIATQISAAREAGAQLVVLPELVISGYPPEDLVLKRDFLDACREALDSLVGESEGIVALVGFPERDGYVHNSAAVLAGGELHGIYRKMLLPNYGVFDERRYFEPGDTPAVIDIGGVVVGLTICEDIWFAGPPSSTEATAGASLIVNPSGSPYHHGKGREREQQIAAARARETGAFFALCNTVGGQDELVFDGQSFVVDGEGNTIARAAQFAEELLVCELALPARGREDDEPRSSPATVLAGIAVPELQGDAPAPRVAEPFKPDEAEVYEALKLGLRDYVTKNRFGHVVIALSGGIDSALVAAVAVDALGSERVTCVSMPSPFSSEGTRSDARQIAENLGTELIEIPIEPAMRAYQETLAEPFAGAPGDPGLTRGELAGADPRKRRDGAFEPLRLARTDDGEQERAFGRLRDALRRHGGRLRRDQGLLQVARLPTRSLSQRARRAAADSGVGARSAAFGRAAPRPAR